MSEPTFIDTDEGLGAVADTWSRYHALHLDTEFVRTRTYFARPGLIQAHDGEAIYLLDPIAIQSWGPLRDVLAPHGTTKVFHAAGEDLDLLARLTGQAPQPVFDTQIAAAFCGLGPSASYRDLAQRMLGIELPKSETRSNWCQRPLGTAQLRYASEDVAHLPALHESLWAELSARGRLGWAEDEFALSTRRVAPAEEGYRRLRIAARLPRRELAVLRALYRWREEEAQRRDLPRVRVVSDPALVALAEMAPESPAALGDVPDLPPSVIRRQGDVLVELVAQARASPPETWPAPLALPADLRDLLSRMRELIARRAAALDLPAALLASRRQLEQLLLEVRFAGAGSAGGLLSGWRAEAFGAELAPLLEQARASAG